MAKTPNIPESELNKLEKQFDAFDQSVKNAVNDRTYAPAEQEPQTKMSSREIAKSDDVYLKPIRRVGSKEPFNEKFRSQYEHAKEFVKFIFENKEIIGETTTMWTKPFPGVPAEEWQVPANKPIYGPRYLAEQIKRKYYNRLIMDQNVKTGAGEGTYYGAMVKDSTIQRLDAYPAGDRKQLFVSKSF